MLDRALHLFDGLIESPQLADYRLLTHLVIRQETAYRRPGQFRDAARDRAVMAQHRQLLKFFFRHTEEDQAVAGLRYCH